MKIGEFAVFKKKKHRIQKKYRKKPFFQRQEDQNVMVLKQLSLHEILYQILQLKAFRYGYIRFELTGIVTTSI